jgi:hypothetical protein
MYFKPAFVSFVVAAVATVTQAAETKWYTQRSCGGTASLDYKDLGCNVCNDPDLSMPSPFPTFSACILWILTTLFL